MNGLNVTDVRTERIPLLKSTVGETALVECFCSSTGIRSIRVSAEERSFLDGVYTLRRSEK